MVIHESLLLPTASQNPRWLNVRLYLSKKDPHSGSDSNPYLGCACNQKFSMSQESPRAQSRETMSVFFVLSKKCQELESGIRRVGGLWFLSVFLWCGYELGVNKFIRKKDYWSYTFPGRLTYFLCLEVAWQGPGPSSETFAWG